MSDDFGWLPPLEPIEKYGEWDCYEAALYNIFCNDFISNPPRFKGRGFKLKAHPQINGRHATFWHLISSGSVEENRQISHDRCARIRWPRKMIDGLRDGLVHHWRAERKGDERLHIALKDYSYLVVLAIRPEYVLLWTAFSIELEHTRRKYQRECEAYRATK